MVESSRNYRGVGRKRPKIDNGYYLDIVAEVSVASGLNPMDVAELPLPVFNALQRALLKRAENG